MFTMQFAIGFYLGIQFHKWLLIFMDWRYDAPEMSFLDYIDKDGKNE